VASIAAFSFNKPILVDTKPGIIARHGRFLAARKLQLREVPVIVWDHRKKRAYMLADNQLALTSTSEPVPILPDLLDFWSNA
jgi:ParB-like chromosome segregation protein Spo0J